MSLASIILEGFKILGYIPKDKLPPDHIEHWYSKDDNAHIIQVMDKEGNQIGDATYVGHKSRLQSEIDYLRRKHRITKVIKY